MRKTSKYRKPEFWLQLAANIFGALLAVGVFLPDSLGAKLIAAGVLVLANLGFVAPVAMRGLRRLAGHGRRVLRWGGAKVSQAQSREGVGKFLTDLEFEADDESNMYRLTAPLEYLTADGESIVVPSGFITDFYSIPAIIKWLFGDIDGRLGAAAVIHDYLYSLQTCKRARADEILREAMLALGATTILADIVYAGVRGFGWIGWAIDANQVGETGEIQEIIDEIDAEYVHAAMNAGRETWVFTTQHQVILQLRWAQLARVA